MNKPKQLKIISSIIIGFVFLFLAYGSDSDSKTESGDDTSTTEQTSTVADNNCGRCGGSGQVATYGAGGCSDMSHFPAGDCGQDHHTDSCISSGSKTCPCCHGTGKRS